MVMEAIRKLKSDVSKVLVVVACFLQIIGFVTPGWIKTERILANSHIKMASYGVWYATISISEESYETVSMVGKGKIQFDIQCNVMVWFVSYSVRC